MEMEEFRKITGWSNYDITGSKYGFLFESKINLGNVHRVIASSKGENDGDDWIALLQMNDGTIVYAEAGCCYTGWDCQAGGYNKSYPDFLAAVHPMNMTEDVRKRLEIPDDPSPIYMLIHHGITIGEKEKVDYRDITNSDIEKALEMAFLYGQNDGSHHKTWVIDEMVRALTGYRYDDWVDDYEEGGDEWDTGIPP